MGARGSIYVFAVPLQGRRRDSDEGSFPSFGVPHFAQAYLPTYRGVGYCRLISGVATCSSN